MRGIDAMDRCPDWRGSGSDAVPRWAGWAALAVAVGVAITALPRGVHAQSASASYQVPRQSIDAGAGRATSATYTLNGTVGQPDAGAPMASPSYQVRGGFHVAAPLPDRVFGDGFEAP